MYRIINRNLILVAILFSPVGAYAYIGPGAGFAFLGSGFVVVLSIAMALCTLLLWPLQWVFRRIKRSRLKGKQRIKRVVIVGLDGLEPKLCERFLSEGRLPSLQKLASDGGYRRLGTTLPAISPVAWSTFQTGVNPGAHNIFDFLTRDKRFCLPELASSKILPPRRVLKLGKLEIPLTSPKIVLTRKATPFWKILGRYGIFSNIIRVPISYPPEKFFGNVLSAMCTPDIRGTQGTFMLFTTRLERKSQAKKDIDNGQGDFERIEASGGYSQVTGGEKRSLERRPDGTLSGEFEGPPNPRPRSGSKYLSAPFTLKATKSGGEILCGEAHHTLEIGKFSPWITIKFECGRRTIQGIVRVLLREVGSEVTLYASPVNVDPESPALPIAAPLIFSNWLAKKNGKFGTLGLLEDTWGRNEHALNDQGFLDQAYLTHAEREKMFFDAMDRTDEGVCVCVFDATDRIQHMFWRYVDPLHPAPRESEEFNKVVPEMYVKMDDLVGRVRSKCRPGDLLVVMSDHGFASFRRCVGLNAWLYQQGYLCLKGDKPTGADYFQDVDWSRTRAYACGLTGIYLNRIGRERQGIVDDQDADSLLREIADRLESLRDPNGDMRAIRKVYLAQEEYRGLYVDEAPDLIVGCEDGYRVSWDSVTGIIEDKVFSDNLKAWSGDHHVDPSLVPGVLFASQPIKSETPNIIDLAPSVLDLFGVSVPSQMEGRVVF